MTKLVKILAVGGSSAAVVGGAGAGIGVAVSHKKDSENQKAAAVTAQAKAEAAQKAAEQAKVAKLEAQTKEVSTHEETKVTTYNHEMEEGLKLQEIQQRVETQAKADRAFVDAVIASQVDATRAAQTKVLEDSVNGAFKIVAEDQDKLEALDREIFKAQSNSDAAKVRELTAEANELYSAIRVHTLSAPVAEFVWNLFSDANVLGLFVENEELLDKDPVAKANSEFFDSINQKIHSAHTEDDIWAAVKEFVDKYKTELETKSKGITDWVEWLNQKIADLTGESQVE